MRISIAYIALVIGALTLFPVLSSPVRLTVKRMT